MSGRRPSPLPIVWASHLIAMIPLTVIMALTDPFGARSEHALVLAGSALVPATASLAVGRLVLKGLPAPSVWILRWAMAEAVGIVGLMTRFLGGPLPVASGLLLLGVALILAQYPREDAAGP